MKQYVLSVRDAALDSFGPPFFAPAIGAAVRGFMDEVNRPDSPVHAHPEDYDLYHLGSFDQATGRFENLEVPHLINRGKEMKTKPESSSS